MPALTEIEALEFPQPVGRAEAFVTSGGTSTAPETFRDRLADYDYKTVRYPGHVAKIRLLRDLGLLDTTPVDAGGVRVAPRDVFHAVVGPRITFPNDRDLVVLRVVCTGADRGAPRAAHIDLLDFFDERTGFSAMERTTAFPAAACLHFQAAGKVPPGAFPPERAFGTREYVDAVLARGLALVAGG